MSKAKPCSICGEEIEAHANPITGEVYWTEGHNAQPITNGRCCDSCNRLVIAERIIRATAQRRGEEL